MKKLKIFLVICLCISLVIPKTFAYEIDNVTFDNALGYVGYHPDFSDWLVYDPTNNLDNKWIVNKNEPATFSVRLRAVDTSTVATGQMILYVNMCLNSANSNVKYYNTSNTIGSLVKLEKIGQSTQLLSCDHGGYYGDLVQTSWIMNYNLVRDGSSGNSFLDSTIQFYIPDNPLTYNSTASFVNVFIDEYDENVVQSIKQSQIGNDTNQHLISVNNKLDDLNDTINDSDITDAENTANGFFDNFTDNDYGLSSVITIPLSSVQKITNATCTPINLPIPFTNTSIPLPCMYDLYEDNVPLLLNIWQIVSFGLISYAIIVDIFGMVKKFKDPNDDKLEVMDL